MAFNLRLTNAGRAALADQANVGVNAVRLTHVAIGDGSGPGGAADDGLAALRSERDRQAAAGSAPIQRRIAFRADFTPAAAYGITEVGVLGNVPGQAARLLAYWSDGGTAIGQTAAGTKFVIAASLEFANAAADINITVNPNISLGGSALPATTGRRGIAELATSDEAKEGTDEERALTPKAARDAAASTVASLLDDEVAEGTKYALRGKAAGGLGLEADQGDAAAADGIAATQESIAVIQAAIQGLPGQVDALTDEVGAVKGRVGAVEAKTGDATTSRKGVVELATSDEAKAGTDEGRALTPKAARDSTSENLESLLAGNPTEGTKYGLIGLANGRLAVAELPFDLFAFEAGASETPALVFHRVTETLYDEEGSPYSYTHPEASDDPADDPQAGSPAAQSGDYIVSAQAVSFDGLTYWEAPSTGMWALAAMAKVPGVSGRGIFGSENLYMAFYRRPAGSPAWSYLMSQGRAGLWDGEHMSAVYCGNVAAGDRIACHYTADDDIRRDQPSEFEITAKVFIAVRM